MIDNEDKFAKKMKYMYSIDDVLIKPQEVWYHPDDETTYYLKKYNSDIVIVVKVKNGIFLDYDVIENDYDEVDILRYGVLEYASD